MKRLALLFPLVLGCKVSDRTVIRVAEEAGLHSVEPGYALWGCSDDDDLAASFTAKTADGHDVAGVVCCGWLFKACTVRFS